MTFLGELFFFLLGLEACLHPFQFVYPAQLHLYRWRLSRTKGIDTYFHLSDAVFR